MSYPKDTKEALTSGRKPDITHVRTPLMYYVARSSEYGDARYERANFIRPTGDNGPHSEPTAHDFRRLRSYLRATVSHLALTLESMENHLALDPTLLDIEGMKRACFAIDTDVPERGSTGPSFLPHLAPATSSLNMALKQATDCGLLPLDPGQTWLDSREAVEYSEERRFAEQVQPDAMWSAEEFLAALDRNCDPRLVRAAYVVGDPRCSMKDNFGSPAGDVETQDYVHENDCMRCAAREAVSSGGLPDSTWSGWDVPVGQAPPTRLAFLADDSDTEEHCWPPGEVTEETPSMKIVSAAAERFAERPLYRASVEARAELQPSVGVMFENPVEPEAFYGSPGECWVCLNVREDCFLCKTGKFKA